MLASAPSSREERLNINLRDLLEEMVSKHASDLHFTAHERPKLRVDGSLVDSDYSEMLTPKDTLLLAYSILTEKQKRRFETDDELDFAFGIQNLARFRANVYKQRGSVAIAIRQIPFKIRSFNELGLPKSVSLFAERPNGLVLVTGPTGSGKTTTLAALIDKINSERHGHILTVEDPIEFVHRHQNCIVNQREIGADTASFAVALKYALRQDPDIILIGEVRDLETISAALTIAETGHLVFATLHTNSAAETITRIIDVFPQGQQAQIRNQLGFVLEGIVTQTLIPRARGRGRVMAAEVLVITNAVRALIRDDKVHQIYSLMQAGQKHGMQTMNQALYTHYVNREITEQEALRRSNDPDDLCRMMGRQPPSRM
jgi:twitching motility protein PilT